MIANRIEMASWPSDTVFDIVIDPFASLDLPDGIGQAATDAIGGLGRPGRWWTGQQRLAIAEVARRSQPRALWDRIPPLESLEHHDSPDLSPFVAALAELITVETSAINSETIALIEERIGDAAYAELCAIVAQVAAIDQLCHALGVELAEFPAAVSGVPSRVRPEGMGDAGGHIEMTADFEGPNVARSLSLAAEDHLRWRALVLSMYSRDGFFNMVWTDRALTRPQVELLAARTSALNECFY